MRLCRTKKARPENSSPLFRASITATRVSSAMSRARVYATVEEMPRVDPPSDPRFVNRVGQVFNRLTVLHYCGKSSHNTHWACRCVCGRLVVVSSGNLRGGNTLSCGCLSVASIRERSTTHGLTAGATYHPLYNVYHNILNRCTDPHNPGFSYYGGRGVQCRFSTVVEFVAYVEKALGPKPPGGSLDRIDNAGHYAPGNLRWATKTDQSRNRRSNRLVTIGEDTIPVVVAAERAGLKPGTLRARLANGWEFERAISTPVRRYAEATP